MARRALLPAGAALCALAVALFPVLPAAAAAPAPAVAPAAAPDAPAADAPAPDDFDARRAEVLRHREEEARTKATRMLAWQQLDRAVTPNQNEYDFRHYDLDLDLDPASHILSGTVITTADVTGGPVSTLDLNLTGDMTVSAATVNGAPATFSHPANVLTVDLDRSYSAGETVVVGVTYSGNPAGSSFGWDSVGGQDMIWTLSEPYGAREWWPCSDHTWDKPDSVDITVTVPDNLIVASNGILVSDVDNGATRTFHWDCDYPIATYLVSLAVHPYDVHSDWYTPQGGGDPMEVQFFVYQGHWPTVQTNYLKTVPMIDAFAQAFGEYPFVDEKYGHAEFTWGGGMEHQTCTSLGGSGEDLISHELAHQWFGDNVTCDTFHHIWLNEGFATWCEAYWREATEGFDRYREYMDFAAYYGPGTIYVENPNDFNEIFDSNLSYNKGSWIVHMLRGVVGDAAFFPGLLQYRAQYGGGTATTEQLRDVMEAVSGRDLDTFFQQWIYGEYFPVYRYSWSPAPGGIDLTIEQIQTNTGLFEMPIPIRVQTDGGDVDLVVENALATENYFLAVAGEVQDVLLDPDRWILRQVESTVTNPTFDQGILLVNGVDWETYGTEITTAYADSAFWGDNPITFWDTFSEPAGGYPANLPVPAGHGSVSGGVMGRYSTVIWIGNDYNGDLADWLESPIESYLEVGGNVLLMSRRGENFLDQDLSDYLGITWTANQVTLSNCTAVDPDLSDIPFTGSQSWNDTFSPTVGPNSTLLFRDTASSTRGTGVHSQPPGGGSERPTGGQFVYLSGRPYRMGHAALRGNVEIILDSRFGEPYTPTPAPALTEVGRLDLSPARPNPFRGPTLIPFALPNDGRVEVTVYDAAGRRVRTLVSGHLPAGSHGARWDGRDAGGRPVAAGVYFVRLATDAGKRSRTVVRLR
jgi:hypothetical protein